MAEDIRITKKDPVPTEEPVIEVVPQEPVHRTVFANPNVRAGDIEVYDEETGDTVPVEDSPGVRMAAKPSQFAS